MSRYAASHVNDLFAGDILSVLDTVETITDQLRMELGSMPTLDQRRALVTQVDGYMLQQQNLKNAYNYKQCLVWDENS